MAQQPPVVEEAAAPIYPELAVTARVSGTVNIEVRVSPLGEVTSVAVTQGDPLLRQASLDAAKRWKFRPHSGGPAVKLTFVYRFLQKETAGARSEAVFRPPFTVEVRKIAPEPVRHVARNEEPAGDRRRD